MQKLTRAELQQYMTMGLGFAAMFARWSPTPKDDAAIALLLSLVNNPDTFAKLCDLLGITE